MKHHIVITRGRYVVENMFSKISTPRELRARLAKKYPGKHGLYFRTIDSQYGWFSNGHCIYFWFIDSNPEMRQKRPKPIPEKRLIRTFTRWLELNIPTQNPYGLYEGDVFTIPPFEDIRCVSQRVRENPPAHINLVEATLNGKTSWVSVQDLRRLDNFENQYEALKKLAGKTVRIIEAVRCMRKPEPIDRGLLTGKPLTWRLRTVEYPDWKYKYEIL